MKEIIAKSKLPKIENIESNVNAICHGIDDLIKKEELTKEDRKELIEELEEVIAILQK